MSPLSRLVQALLVLLPVVLLGLASFKAPPQTAPLLWLGTLLQSIGCLMAILSMNRGRQPAFLIVIMLYVTALGWVGIGTAGTDDWFLHLAQAILLVVPLLLFALQCLRDSGAPALRQARRLASRLSHRADWPADLPACRLLPEVKALREALHVDATPALELLRHPRAEVRVAALAALEFRQNWQMDQPQVVLHLARTALEPEVRAGAINALANIDDRSLVETLAEFLTDPAQVVRLTATEAVLWNTEERWPWVRHAVRNALSHPLCEGDGPLRVPGDGLGPDAVGDLHGWAAEKGILAERAARTLGAHYTHRLRGGDPDLVQTLRGQLIDSHTPPMLRLELAHLLSHSHQLDDAVLLHMLDLSMPAPVRLMAAEAFLSVGPHPQAMATLCDLARLPNREIALATADVIQRRLGIDLGLPAGQNLPHVCSRTAADVVRRVQIWAARQTGPPHSSVNPRPSAISRRR